MQHRPVLVNDVHSQLNPTVVEQVVEVESLEQIQVALAEAQARRRHVCIAGGLHAMGGQQLCGDAVLLDTHRLERVLDFDRAAGTIEVEAGLQWPALLRYLYRSQPAKGRPWAIAQKQSGADRLSIGGALAANAHGAGLALAPLVADVESFVLVGADGVARTCSRGENPELFRLAIGGYGLFGVVYSTRLRLVPRRKVQREAVLCGVDTLASAFADRIAEGCLYGDFRFAVDPGSDDFLRRGLLTSYRPVSDATPVEPGQKALSPEEWRRHVYLAHTDKRRAFDELAAHYTATSGQIYYSDAHQLAPYVDDYHTLLDRQLGCSRRATEITTEVFVPRERLADFMAAAAEQLRSDGVDVVSGSVRLIEADGETFLPWARESCACVAFDVHTAHTVDGLARTCEASRRLIGLALERRGSFSLAYHRWASRAQLETAFPQLPAFLAAKKEHDPSGLFSSEWHRHLAALFAGERNGALAAA